MDEATQLHAELERLLARIINLRESNALSRHEYTRLSDRLFCISLHLAIGCDHYRGSMTQSQACNEAAVDMGVSPVTAARYLEKHTTRRAHFQINPQNGLVECRDCTIGMWEPQAEPAQEPVRTRTPAKTKNRRKRFLKKSATENGNHRADTSKTASPKPDSNMSSNAQARG